MAGRLTSAHRDSRGSFVADSELVLEDRPSRAPRAPAWVPADARPAWRALFRAPVAQLWRPEDHHAAARLALLRTAVQGGDLAGTTLSAVARLEAELLLSPKARRQARIRIGPEKPPATLHTIPGAGPFDPPARARVRAALAAYGVEPLGNGSA